MLIEPDDDEVKEVTIIVYGEDYTEDDYEVEWLDWIKEGTGVEHI